MDKDTAILSSIPDYTLFYFNNIRIKFLCPYSLEYYTEIKKWKNGFMTVMAKYKDEELEEEYIDLCPILDNLCIDRDEFLSKIKKVKISYEDKYRYGYC